MQCGETLHSSKIFFTSWMTFPVGRRRCRVGSGVEGRVCHWLAWFWTTIFLGYLVCVLCQEAQIRGGESTASPQGTPSCSLNKAWMHACMRAQQCLTLWGPMDCSPPDSSVCAISQARILEWVAMSFSRGSSDPGMGPGSLALAEWLFTIWATREAHGSKYNML